jgi:hypothetical protein
MALKVHLSRGEQVRLVLATQKMKRTQVYYAIWSPALLETRSQTFDMSLLKFLRRKVPFIRTLKKYFFAALHEIQQHNPIPDGYHVSPNEWPDDGYPVQEFLKVGGSGKYLSIALPFEIWWRRAVKWCQGLDLMMKFLLECDQ